VGDVPDNARMVLTKYFKVDITIFSGGFFFAAHAMHTIMNVDEPLIGETLVIWQIKIIMPDGRYMGF